METTMFYFNDRPVVHSKISGLPFMVSLLRLLFKSFYFSLMSESNHLKGFRFFILYFKRALQHNMPHRNFFCCLLESNQGLSIGQAGFTALSPQSTCPLKTTLFYQLEKTLDWKLEIMETTMFYFNDRPVIHSEISGLPFMVSLLPILFESFYLSLIKGLGLQHSVPNQHAL